MNTRINHADCGLVLKVKNSRKIKLISYNLC